MKNIEAKIINMTAEDVIVQLESGSVTLYRTEGTAIVGYQNTETDLINGIPLKNMSILNTNLPEPVEGVYFIVEEYILSELKATRNDLITIDEHDAEEDDEGNILNVKGFIR